MSVIVLLEELKGEVKKASLEAVYFASLLAKDTSSKCVALALNTINSAEELGAYGAQKVIVAEGNAHFDSQKASKIIKSIFEQEGGHTVIMSHSAKGRALLGRLAVSLDAAIVSGVNARIEVGDGAWKVTKGVFSGKAVAHYSVKHGKRAFTIMGNSVKAEKGDEKATVEIFDASAIESRETLLELRTVEGDIPLPEAELVVSAGRGMKGPENWGIIEEMAKILGAATACSRPVADTGWRPHHEHVGQTGIAIRPILYFAIGISGAIQHLAGVNNSKVIVVINKDPEAPFFKAADYGVCADLFDVVPRLNESLRKFKAQNG